MATGFPASLDALTNPISTDTLATPDHAGQHVDANDALEALQAKVGVDGSAVATSLDKIVSLKANLASPAFTGFPTAVTQMPDQNSTRLATTEFVQSAGALKANLVSPALTGTPTAPTASVGTNTTQLATTAFVQEASPNPLTNASFAAIIMMDVGA